MAPKGAQIVDLPQPHLCKKVTGFDVLALFMSVGNSNTVDSNSFLLFEVFQL